MQRVGTVATGRTAVTLITSWRRDVGGRNSSALRGSRNGLNVGVQRKRQLSLCVVIRDLGVTLIPKLLARRWKSAASRSHDEENSTWGERFVQAIDPSVSISPRNSSSR